MTLELAENLMQPTKGISGSLIAAIAGFSPWSDAVKAYNVIFGLADEEESAAATWGVRIEPLMAREYAQEHGVMLWPHSDFGLDYKKSYLIHPAYDWATGTPDRLVIADPKWLIPLDLYVQDPEAAQDLARQQLMDPNFWDQVLWGWEGKTAGPRMLKWWGEDGTDDVPPFYLCQTTWYQSLTELERWDLSVLLGGQTFRTYYLKREKELEQTLLATGEQFWNKHILTRTPPPRDASPAWKVFFKRWFPVEKEPLREATPAEEHLMADLWEVRQQLKNLSDLNETLSNEMRFLIGDARGIQGKDWSVTFTKNKDGEKTNHEAVLAGLVAWVATSQPGMKRIFNEAYELLLKQHTFPTQGARVLRPSWPKPPKPPKEKKGEK
jgi:predicted phage-related endonuclease